MHFFFFTFVCKNVLDILCASCEENNKLFFFLLQVSFVALFGGGEGTGAEGVERKGGNGRHVRVIIPHLSWLCFPHFWFSDAPEGWCREQDADQSFSSWFLQRPQTGPGEAVHLPERMPAVEQWHTER